MAYRKKSRSRRRSKRYNRTPRIGRQTIGTRL